MTTQSEHDEGEAAAPHPEQIKAAIRMRGTTLSKLATDNGLEASACRQALRRPIPKADKVIAEYLGLPLHQLWPDRYDADGLPISHVRDSHNEESGIAHRLSAGVA